MPHVGERPDRSPGRTASGAGLRSDADRSHAFGSPVPGECRSTNSPADEELSVLAHQEKRASRVGVTRAATIKFRLLQGCSDGWAASTEIREGKVGCLFDVASTRMCERRDQTDKNSD